MAEYPFLRNVESPLTGNQLRPLDSRCRVVQFSDPLTDKDFKKLAAFLKRYPKVGLRIYGHYGSNPDLNFLRYFPFVRRLAIDAFSLDNFDGMAFASLNLEELTLGQTKSKRHSLAFLERFPKLRTLYIEAHTKDIEVIGKLSRLEDLTLRSITLPDLAILKPLQSLLSLDIKLGGTPNIGLPPEIGRLRYLELWMVRGFDDLAPITRVRTLQFLFLQALKNVKKLPSFRPLRKLRRIHLETMKGLSDLRPVAQAPNLEELVVLDMRHLQPEAFRPFVVHPTLRRALVAIGSQQKNRLIQQLLDLPVCDRYGDDFEFDDTDTS